jgi:hypothetical protein
MRASVFRLFATNLLLGLLLSACSSYDSLRPQKVPAGVTIEQAMGIAPKPSRSRSTRSAPQKTAPQQPVPQLATVGAKKTALQAKVQSTRAEPVRPTNSVKSDKLARKRSPLIVVGLKSREQATGRWMLGIASELIPEGEMMEIIPYLPGLYGEPSGQGGYAYLSGSIIIDEGCEDEEGTRPAACPAHTSTIKIIASFDEPADPDMILTTGAIGQLKKFEAKMRGRYGAFRYLKCNVAFEQCIKDRG